MGFSMEKIAAFDLFCKDGPNYRPTVLFNLKLATPPDNNNADVTWAPKLSPKVENKTS